jgi:hypothetical protein
MNNRSISPVPADEYSSVQTARCKTFFGIRISVTALFLVTSFSAARPAGATGQTDLPEKLSALNALVSLTPGEIRTLKGGQPVSRLLDTDPALEVAVLGVVWIAAPASKYTQAMQDIERFEKGRAFQVTKRISEPPRLEDFAALDLPNDEVADLKTCRIGDCELKLSQATIDRIRREIDWSRHTAIPDVKALMRRVALEYVTAYQRGGNAELAIYRDSDRPTFVAREFAAMVDRMPALLLYEPALRQYLLDYPDAQLPNAASFLYWQQVRFGLKPTVRINHVVMMDEPDRVIVASKQLYASHYFWTALELRVLIPDSSRGQGFWFVSLNRGRSDGLTGFVGGLIRGRIRKEALKGLTEGLRATQSKLQRK